MDIGNVAWLWLVGMFCKHNMHKIWSVDSQENCWCDGSGGEGRGRVIRGREGDGMAGVSRSKGKEGER